VNYRIVWGLLLCLPWALAWGQNTNCWVNGNSVSCTQTPSAESLMQQQQQQKQAQQEQRAQQQTLFNQQAQQIQQNAYQQQQLDLQRQQLNLERQQLQQSRTQQQSLVQPSDVDLKAAYCVGVTNIDVATYEENIKSLDKSNNASIRAFKPIEQTLLNRAKQRHIRLFSYLDPRMSNMEMSTVLKAKTQGEDDAVTAAMYFKTVCMPKCGKVNGVEQQKCVDSCNANSEPYQHAKICAKLSFLPY